MLRWLCGCNPIACLFVSNCLCGFVILFVFVWICFVCEILKEALTSCVMRCSQRFGRTSPLLMMEIHRIPNDEYFVKPRSLLWNILSPPYEYFVLNNEFTTCWNSQWLRFENVWVNWPNRICHKIFSPISWPGWYSQNIMVYKELKLKEIFSRFTQRVPTSRLTSEPTLGRSPTAAPGLSAIGDLPGWTFCICVFPLHLLYFCIS